MIYDSLKHLEQYEGTFPGSTGDWSCCVPPTFPPWRISCMK